MKSKQEKDLLCKKLAKLTVETFGEENLERRWKESKEKYPHLDLVFLAEYFEFEAKTYYGYSFKPLTQTDGEEMTKCWEELEKSFQIPGEGSWIEDIYSVYPDELDYSKLSAKFENLPTLREMLDYYKKNS